MSADIFLFAGTSRVKGRARELICVARPTGTWDFHRVTFSSNSSQDSRPGVRPSDVRIRARSDPRAFDINSYFTFDSARPGRFWRCHANLWETSCTRLIERYADLRDSGGSAGPKPSPVVLRTRVRVHSRRRTPWKTLRPIQSRRSFAATRMLRDRHGCTTETRSKRFAAAI